MGIFTKLKDATVQDVLEHNENLYHEIFGLGQAKASEEADAALKVQIAELLKANEELKSKVENFEKIQSIRTFAQKLSVSVTDEMLALSKEDAYELIANSSSGSDTNLEDLKQAFSATAPDIAGDGKSSDLDVQIKDFASAREYIRKRDNCSKVESIKKARVEYFELWDREFGQKAEKTTAESEE